MTKLSAVIPCFNEEAALPHFYKAMCEVADCFSQRGTSTHAPSPHSASPTLELIFVDDGSTDQTLPILKELCEKDPRVHYLSFSRNFGKESAMYAGLARATGDFVALMDADMQDPPSLLPQMYQELLGGDYDNVATRRVSRKGEPPIRSFFARCFYKLIHRISSTEIVDGARDFRLMNRQMVNAILSVGEYNRFSKGIFGWVGFRTKWLPYENVERVAGETKWSFWKLFLYSMEGIVAFSTAPLAVASVAGVFMCLVSFLMIFVIIVKTLLWGDPVSGWPSLACIILFVGGTQLLCTGILGQYLAKTYLESKKRPLYIVREESRVQARGADETREEDGTNGR